MLRAAQVNMREQELRNVQEKGAERADRALIGSEAVSWWSWRPGARPARAFLLGGLLSLIALFLLLNGVTALISGILDSAGAPLRVPGIVTAHGTDMLGSPQLTIRLSEPGLPPTVTLVVSRAASSALANGSAVTVDYAPHQRAPYALESSAQSYPLPGTSASGNLLETLSLLLFGLLLLPYPFFLALWGWRDLRARQSCQRVGSVVALRAARQTTNRTPGMVPRTTHTWYGIAVQIEQEDSSRTEPEILTFSVQEETYRSFKRGDCVQVIYSPYLRHLYALKHL